MIKTKEKTMNTKNCKQPTRFSINPENDIFNFTVTRWNNRYYCGTDSDSTILGLFRKFTKSYNFYFTTWTLKEGFKIVEIIKTNVRGPF
jgi:hypothetical protein